MMLICVFFKEIIPILRKTLLYTKLKTRSVLMCRLNIPLFSWLISVYWQNAKIWSYKWKKIMGSPSVISKKNVIWNIGPGFHNRCIAAKNKTKALNCAALQLHQVQNSREETWLYLEMVHIALCPHHQFTGWNRLTTGAASSAVPK